MESSKTTCPVCTLYLREGITLQDHLETHPKQMVIEALLKVTNSGASQTASSEPSPHSDAGETFPASQSYVGPNASYMSQAQNYINPQTQMTAALTYQQFVTSNGSPVMPHYIQVPTIVAPDSNVSLLQNQALNYQSAYAHTMYNPLYNPYIPQPYPMVQPMYTTFPVTTSSSNTVSDNQLTTSSASAKTSQSKILEKSESVLKKVSSVSTNTNSRKTVALRPRIKKLPIKSSTQTRFRIFKQLGSRLKTTTSTMATVATKSYRITSINSKTNSTAKTSVITKAKSMKKSGPLIPKPIPLSSSSAIISPPPLTPMNRSRSSSVSCSETPPPPPLSKAPCLSPVQPSFEIQGIVKAEKNVVDLTESETNVDLVEKNGSVPDYAFDHREVPSVNSVIVESNSAIQITSNIVINKSVSEENNATSSYKDGSIAAKLDDSATNTRRYSESSVNESTNGDTNRVDGFENEQNPLSDYNDEDDDDELSEKVFHTLEFEEEKKVAFNFDISHHNVANEINGVSIERHDGCDMFMQGDDSISLSGADEGDQGKISESTTYTEGKSRSSTNNNCCIPNNTSQGIDEQNPIRSEVDSEKLLNNTRMIEAVTPTLEQSKTVSGLKSLTYTDLQPTTNTKVLQDLGITNPLNINNYMEVDGIRIFFSNSGNQNVPLEPIIKFTSGIKNDMTSIQTFTKSENDLRRSDSLADSVIHMVSGKINQKSDPTSEGLSNSNSHPSDGQLDLRDLSPLTLNIQADESMPARGELSEQESLGAENSNWALFHSESGNSVETPLIWKTDSDAQSNVLDVRECDKDPKKVFKCSFCPEVFTCLKDRRVHRNTVHEKSQTPAARKPKKFVCSQCKQVFPTLKDRRRHVIQVHYVEKKGIKQECEARDESLETSENLDTTVTEASVKQEVSETIVKCESTITIQRNKDPCEFTKNCPQCDIPVTGQKKLREHMKEVHGECRYKCDHCPESFDSEQDYNSHLLIHPLTCDQCGKTFNRKANLRLHLRRHLVVKPYICSLCPKSFITRQKLDEHMNGHSGKKPLKCTMCDSTFSRHSNLIQHRNIRHLHAKKKVKDFICRCGEVFHSLRKLHWHKEVHDTKPKTCPFCSQKFIHRNSVTRHVRRSHMPDYLPNDKKCNENVQCPVCEKIYLRSSLIVHMRVHNGEKPFVCKICSRRFTTKWNLELHNWTHQSRNNMPFKCTVCKSAFFREVDYVAHLNSHRNYRPFTCNICGEKFIRKYNCLRHQEEHKKEKKFVCTVTGCGKSFHRSYYLKDHMRVHTGVRPHTCHICGKASSTKSNHNKHVRIHDTREPVNTEN